MTIVSISSTTTVPARSVQTKQPVLSQFSSNHPQFGNFLEDNPNLLSNIKKWSLRSVLGLFGFTTVLDSYTTIPSGEAGVVYNSISGTTNRVMGEGLNFKIPYLDKVFTYDVTDQMVRETVSNQSLDNVPVTLEIRATFRLDPEKLPLVQRTIVGGMKEFKDEEIEKYIKNDRTALTYVKTLRQELRSLAGQMMSDFTAEKMNDNRQNITNGLKYGKSEGAKKVEGLIAALKERGVIVVDVEVTAVDLPDPMQEKINDRANSVIEQQTSANNILTSQNNAKANLETARGEALANEERAKGEANAIRVRGQAIRENPQVLELEKLKAIGEAGKGGNTVIFYDKGTSSQVLLNQNNKK